MENNGDTLREIVLGLATQWSLSEPFIDYVRERCVWVNSLVDRIVSEPIDPVGAVAEPYALWAVERRAGMELPCTHESLVLTGDLRSHERLKLFFSILAIAGWRSSGLSNSDRCPKRCSMQCMIRICVMNSKPYGERRLCLSSGRRTWEPRPRTT